MRKLPLLVFLAMGLPGSPAHAASGCPDREPTALKSQRAGASSQLVPAGQTSVLLCRYAGLNGPGPRLALLGGASVTDSAAVDDLAAQMNSLSSGPAGPVACPSDDASQITATFAYGGPPKNPVAVSLSGCTTATNGVISRVANSTLLSRLKTLVPVPKLATVSGSLRVCGGPHPGRCHIGSLTLCDARGGGATTDRVEVVGQSGSVLSIVPLRTGRFRVRLAPGSYRMKLLADGARVHRRVVETAPATPTEGGTFTVAFAIDVP